MVRYLKKYFFFVLLFLAIAIIGCASTRKNPWVKERKKTGLVTTSRLGKNKYYFSSGYQKRLSKSMRKK